MPSLFPRSTAPLLSALLTCFVPLAAVAGRIQIQPDVRVTVSNGVPLAAIQLFNTGEESARILSMEVGLAFTGREDRLAGASPDASGGGSMVLPKTLSPGDTMESTIQLATPGMPGFHQAVTRIRYADFTGVTFSTVTVSSFAMPGAARPADDSWIAVSMEPATIGRSGPVRVSLQLLEDHPVEVTVRLIVPDEFAASAPEQRVRLEPDSPRELTLRLDNRGALPGGVYPVVAVVGVVANGEVRSSSASGTVAIGQGQWVGQSPWVWLSGALLLLLAMWAARRGRRGGGRPVSTGFELFLLAVFTVYIGWNLSPADWFSNTATVGGDTPAHLYLVSHLREQLFHHGRLISWAGGWWGGFPMFQFYFVLPYLAAALLSMAIPLAIAFKLATVAGLILTPCCAWWAARLWRLPQPIPVVMALAMVPFLFVQTHVMWGVNTASTLAGMIANSWSFALMLPALASASRDAGDGVIRLRSIMLMVLVLASHFFTSVMMFLSLAIVPWLPPLKRAVPAVRVLVAEGAVALLLMGWWLVPLVAKSRFSMDFGTNWAVQLPASLPHYAAGLLVLALVAVGLAISRPLRAVWILSWMLGLGALLFAFGFALSPVFVNVRLWPFVFFALVALAAIGLGALLAGVRGQKVWISVLAVAVLLAVTAGDSLTGRLNGPGLTRSWAHWNYSGLQVKPAASVFEKLVMPLRGTPGRLANDLCEENNQLGSSRVFELSPWLAGKPVLEGGLVNSALGSMYAYTIQGESSASCAGFPPIVVPRTFNITNATRHLELFNVKHFIARNGATKQALRDHPAWRSVGREQEWELFELMTHGGQYVFIPPRMPVAVQTTRWMEDSLEWLYHTGALDQFVVWSSRAMPNPRLGGVILEEDEFRTRLAAWQRGETGGKGGAIPEAGTGCIRDEVVTDNVIRFHTAAVGRPHIIRMSWFPNWKVRGAEGVYCVSPGFMMVIPRQADVELYYGSTPADGVGYALTVLGIGLLSGRVLQRVVGKRSMAHT